MKLKNRDWTEGERRLGTVGSRLEQQDRIVCTALSAIIVFGVAVLAVVAGYLVCLSWLPGR